MCVQALAPMQVKYHHPPRLPRKHVHALRHGAALAYQKLGLKGGAQVSRGLGWQASC